MEQIPGPLAKTDKLLAFGALSIGAVPALTKWLSSCGGSTVAQRGAPSFFILCPCPPLTGASAGVSDRSLRLRPGGWRRWGLVAAVMY